jgi:hypothetical protein
MVVVGFKALRPLDKEVGSDTAMVARSAIQGRCVREWLLVWVCSVAGTRVSTTVFCFRTKKHGLTYNNNNNNNIHILSLPLGVHVLL